tara:strand:+ start:375 stop:638 length:264 start_codon:yes stop_codon:yes gene_type:complete
MAKAKNFKIIRNRTKPLPITVGSYPIGDVFEKDGTLHMKIHGMATLSGESILLDLNTGAYWSVVDSLVITPVYDVEFKYNLALDRSL